METPLDRFLLSLRARDASEHTLRSYATSVGAYLEWLAERGADWRTPARTDLRGYLAKLVSSGARTSESQRLAAIRSFHRFAARAGLAAGDPWGSIATPRLPRRLPRDEAFSFTLRGAPWTDFEWLFQLGVLAFERLGGFPALWAYKALLWVLAGGWDTSPPLA